MGTILIVDDNLDAARPLARLLKHGGHAWEAQSSRLTAAAQATFSCPTLYAREPLTAMAPPGDL